ncbi:MAG: hypothetical protein ACLGHC_01105 [Alphaproteobacteria bacterium]
MSGGRAIGEECMGGNHLLPADEMERFFARDDMLPHVTANAVADALKVSGLPLQPRCSLDWLATAVRRALAITILHVTERPERPSNRETKRELEKLATRAGKLWLAVQQRSDAADSAIWLHSFKLWNGEGGTDVGDGIVIGTPADSKRFHLALAELDWLSSFLRDAAQSAGAQQPRWREAETRQIRIERAEYLAPIYKTAFGLDELIRFKDFYQAMVTLAFDEGDIPDLEAVISEARRRHSQTPATFADGVIPDPY